MVKIFAPAEQIDLGSLLSELKGEFVRQCMDKIRLMNGRIVAIDFMPGQWQGEHIWYEVGEPGNFGFAELRTDDPCVSWASMGSRWANRAELIAEVTANHDERAFQQEREAAKAQIKSGQDTTNLVMAPA